MKLNTLITRYIFLEMLPPFFINMLFFTFVFLLTGILDIANMIVNYRVGIGAVLRMILYTTPYFMVYVIPMSVMTAILLTFLRLSTDNEIAALKSGGVSILSLFPPVFVFSLIGCLLTGLMTVYGLPWGKTSLKSQSMAIAASNINIGVKERTFNDVMGVMLYINKINPGKNELTDVFLEDQRNPKLNISVVAPKGFLLVDEKKPAFHLKLLNGTSHRVDLKTRTIDISRFESYEVNIDLQSAASMLAGRPKDDKEMSVQELLAYIEKKRDQKDSEYYKALIELHKRFSIPAACIFLGLPAVPLGIQSKSSRRSFGLFLGLIFFLSYYLLYAMGKVFGESGNYPPVVGMWVPNIATGLVGGYLFYRVMYDRPIKLQFFLNFFMHLKSLPIYPSRFKK